MKTCCKCGQELPDEARYCYSCGAAQDGCGNGGDGSARQEKGGCGCPFSRVIADFREGGIKKAARGIMDSQAAAAAGAKLKEWKDAAGPRLKDLGGMARAQLEKARKAAGEKLRKAASSPEAAEGEEELKKEGRSLGDTARKAAGAAMSAARSLRDRIADAVRQKTGDRGK